jgi:hypothetical protein
VQSCLSQQQLIGKNETEYMVTQGTCQAVLPTRGRKMINELRLPLRKNLTLKFVADYQEQWKLAAYYYYLKRKGRIPPLRGLAH